MAANPIISWQMDGRKGETGQPDVSKKATFRYQVIPRRLLNHRILRKMLIKTQQTPFPAPGCKRPAVHSTWQRLHSPSLNAHEEDANHLETVRDFILLGSKIPADGDCSHEIKRLLLLGRKAMTNLDSILKTETLLCQQRSI